MPADIANVLKVKGILTEDNGLSTEGKFPPEILQRIADELGGIGLSLEEALEHREKLMAERTEFKQATGFEWENTIYNFCEH